MDLRHLSAHQISVIEQTAGLDLVRVNAREAEQFAKLGNELLQAGDNDNALKALELAHAGQPTNTDVAIAYAIALVRTNDVRRGRNLLAQVLVRDRQRIDVWCAIAEVDLDAMRYRAAARALKRCLELDPKAEHPSGRRARALIKKGEKLLQQAKG